MKNAAKKYIAILLTLIMVLNIVPITSLSEENDGTTKPVSVMTKLGTGKSNPYKYIISILNSDDHVVTPDLPTDLNDNNWALVSRLVKQNEEPYFAVTVMLLNHLLCRQLLQKKEQQIFIILYQQMQFMWVEIV